MATPVSLTICQNPYPLLRKALGKAVGDVTPPSGIPRIIFLNLFSIKAKEAERARLLRQNK